MTAAQARQLDARAARLFKVSTRLLMENAGAGCARVALSMWTRGSVLVCCGPGGNGGDGYVIARHLALAGVPTTVMAVGLPRPGTDAANARASWLALCRAGLVPGAPRSAGVGLVVDALLGTGVTRAVEEPMCSAIQTINALCAHKARVLSVDLPSGLCADTGAVMGAAVRAHCTATIAAPKVGLGAASAKRYTGSVLVVPFGAPAVLTPVRARQRG